MNKCRRPHGCACACVCGALAGDNGGQVCGASASVSPSIDLSAPESRHTASSVCVSERREHRRRVCSLHNSTARRTLKNFAHLMNVKRRKENGVQGFSCRFQLQLSQAPARVSYYYYLYYFVPCERKSWWMFQRQESSVGADKLWLFFVKKKKKKKISS